MENLYLIEMWNENERFYKIGVTVHKYCRFYQLMKFGYKVNITYMILGIDALEAMNAEMTLHKLFKSYKPLVKFGGYRECFSDINIDFYKGVAHGLITNHNKVVKNLTISWR